MAEKKLVLFGTGGTLSTYEDIVTGCKIEFDYYADNDKNKWETDFRGKKVLSPSELVDIDSKIMITSYNYIDEITNQLESMGLKDRIISCRSIIKEYIQNHLSDFDYLKQKSVHHSNGKKIIFDLFYGTGWGGSEDWTYSVAEGMANKGYESEIIGTARMQRQPDNIEQFITRVERGNKSFWEIICSIAAHLVQQLPFVLIDNTNNYPFIACYIIKQFFPDDIHIISIAHSDISWVYNNLSFWKDSIDSIACVSTRIKEKMHEEYGVELDKLHYRGSPIEYERSFQKKYSIREHPLRIGYAGRLEVTSKRADLLPKLIIKLIAHNIDFILEIAGDGRCYKLIDRFIADNNLSARVILLGYVYKQNMPAFWKKQDLFVNFSEVEGTSLSMLEAMSYGAVPVVTDVSGVRDFIKDHVNGCISQIGDLEDMAENIKYLSENRDILSQYGDLCRKEIETRCNKSDYVDYISDLCSFETK